MKLFLIFAVLFLIMTKINRVIFEKCLLILVDDQNRGSWEMICSEFKVTDKESFLASVQEVSEDELKLLAAKFCKIIKMDLQWLRDLYNYEIDRSNR